MKEKIIFYGACVIASIMTINYMIKQPKTTTSKENEYTLTQPAKAIKYSNPLKCSINMISVLSVEDKTNVVGSNYMTAYKSVIQYKEQDFSVYFITDGTTGPWVPNQKYGVLGSCESISELDLVNERKKNSENPQVKENDCMGVFYWDKETHQVSRQCAQALGDYLYLGWDSIRSQAPLNK